ncbi:MAG: MFS transporter [Candidatus Adiutrix sp.]|jgi:MFS family permease|nr:MFS transporter [Candidatus Adiutrix sp.]
MAKPEASTGGSEHPETDRLWTGNFLKFLLINLFIFLGFDILLPTLTLYLESFGATEADIGRIYSVFVISAIFMRMNADRLAAGRSALSLVCLGLWACGLAVSLYYWVTHPYLAMGVRLLQGAGLGLATTLLTSLASQAIPPSRMGEGMGYLGLGTTLALAIGPFLGVWLMKTWGFGPLFAVVALCYLASIGVARTIRDVKLPPPRAGRARPGLVLFSRLVWPQSLLMFIMGLIFNTVIVYMALFCKERGLAHADGFFVLSTVGILISRLNSGRLYDSFGHRCVITPAAGLLLTTMLILYNAYSPRLLFTASLLYGLSTGALFPSLQALTLANVPLDRRTEATASFMNSYDLGFGLGSFLMGQLAFLTHRYAAVYLAAAGGALIFLAFYLGYYFIWLRRRP